MVGRIRRRAPLALPLLLVVSVATCKSRPTEPPDSAWHQAHLAERESAVLAAELVEIPGYFYEDVSAEELKNALAQWPEGLVVGVSLHGVREVSSGDEIAFLQLIAIDPTDALHAPANEDEFSGWFSGTEDTQRMELSGQTVFLAEDPSTPDSRYQYVWLRQGTAGWADGPDQATLEGWLKAYFALPVVRPDENAALVERLVDVPGFAYANDTRPEAVQAFTGEPFAGDDYSIHQVFDENHGWGTMVLIGPDTSLTEDDFVAGVASTLDEVMGTQPIEAGGFHIEGMAVSRFLSTTGSGADITTFVWWWADARIGGALATERSDIGEPFLRSFLADQPV